MKQVIEFLSGKKTYLVAGAAVVYLVVCQFTGKTPDDSILSVFGFLGLTFLRMGVTKAVQAAQSSPPTTDQQ